MTPEQAQVRFDAARLRYGDVLMDPDATERDYDRAKEVLDQAWKVLRGTPRTYAGIRRTA